MDRDPLTALLEQIDRNQDLILQGNIAILEGQTRILTGQAALLDGQAGARAELSALTAAVGTLADHLNEIDRVLLRPFGDGRRRP